MIIYVLTFLAFHDTAPHKFEGAAYTNLEECEKTAKLWREHLAEKGISATVSCEREEKMKEIPENVLTQRIAQFLENKTNTPYPWDTARKLLDYIKPWAKIVEREDVKEVEQWKKKMTQDFWEGKK